MTAAIVGAEGALSRFSLSVFVASSLYSLRFRFRGGLQERPELLPGQADRAKDAAQGAGLQVSVVSGYRDYLVPLRMDENIVTSANAIEVRSHTFKRPDELTRPDSREVIAHGAETTMRSRSETRGCHPCS